jgi:hypothetical protein
VQSESGAIAECTECGCCCFNEEPTWIRVFHHDEERMSEKTLAMTHFIGEDRYMKWIDGRCVALDLEPQHGRVACQIHPERPDACRWLERGSHECRQQIASKRALVELKILRR